MGGLGYDILQCICAHDSLSTSPTIITQTAHKVHRAESPPLRHKGALQYLIGQHLNWYQVARQPNYKPGPLPLHAILSNDAKCLLQHLPVVVMIRLLHCPVAIAKRQLQSWQRTRLKGRSLLHLRRHARLAAGPGWGHEVAGARRHRCVTPWVAAPTAPCTRTRPQ